MLPGRRSGHQASTVALATALLAAVFPPGAPADRVTLRNGTELQGRIESEDAGRVAIRTASGRIVVPKDRIASTTRQGAADSAVAIASDALARNDLPGAMAMLSGQALGPVALGQFDRAIVERADRLLVASPRPSRDDAARLAAYVDQRRANTAEASATALGMFAARWSAAAGETSAAAARLVAIGPGRLAEAPARSRSAAADILAVGAAEALAAGADPDTAGAVLDTLGAIAPDRASTGVTVLLGLRAARRAAAAGRSADAMEDLMRRVTPHAPAVAWAEAAALLDKAAAAGDTTLTVALATRALAGARDKPVFPSETANLLARQCRGLLTLGRAEEAEIAAERLATLDAETAAPLQHGVELLRREQALTPSDALGRYRLAGWAAGRELPDDALRLYRAAAAHPDLRANASLQARLLATKTDRADFDAAAGLMESRRPLEALRRAEVLKARAADPEMARRAAELAELARFQSWAGAQSRPAQAEALRQQAERLIMQSRFVEARLIVDRLDSEFADTAAGAAARRFRDQLSVRGFGPPVTRVGSAKAPVDAGEERRAAARSAEMARLAASLAGRE